MTERVLGGWLLASLGFHALGLVTASALARAPETAAPAPAPVPVEMVRLEPPPPPPPAPPRLKAVAPRPVPQPARTEPVDTVEPEPDLMADSPAAPQPAMQNPPTASAAPLFPSSAPRATGAPSAGRLFTSGDLLVAPGRDGGGSGAGSAGASTAAATNGAGLTALARPLGGYQVKPTYPESARRARVEGVALLRFVVLANGHVGTVTVAESAGHGDLDRAAIEAIKQWQFEPARRGSVPVAVWVTLPVRFELER
jgi:protein TonB